VGPSGQGSQHQGGLTQAAPAAGAESSLFGIFKQWRLFI
jgi:hypothetical protein